MINSKKNHPVKTVYAHVGIVEVHLIFKVVYSVNNHVPKVQYKVDDNERREYKDHKCQALGSTTSSTVHFAFQRVDALVYSYDLILDSNVCDSVDWRVHETYPYHFDVLRPA